MAVLVVVCVADTSARAADDLGRVYRGRLDQAEHAFPQNWTAHVDDVWKLKGFRWSQGKKLELTVGAATVVVGKNVGKRTGKSALWAAVFPHADDGSIDAPGLPGDGEKIRSIFLRFHPGRIGRLFPKKSVEGRGEPRWLVPARNLYRYKIQAFWTGNYLPIVPNAEFLLLDVETEANKRRCYVIDLKSKGVRYERVLTDKVVPAPPRVAIESAAAVAAYDEVWKTFDEKYAMFGVKKDVDWKRLGALYRPLAVEAGTRHELAGVIALLVSHLRDLHVHVSIGEDWFLVAPRSRPTNANFEVTKRMFGGTTDTGRGVLWGEQKGIGYINVLNLNDKSVVAAFDDALEKLRKTRGLIVDLRFNGGGQEDVAWEIAGRFLDRERVYSLNRYRSGPKHDQLGQRHERRFSPRGPWRYERPTAVLFGQRTMSSAESMALMFAQCPQVTTVGDRTAGSSANPRRITVAESIEVNVPRWLDMTPEGTIFEDVGIEPDVAVPMKSYAAYRGDKDPVVESALRVLKHRRK